MAFSWLGVHLVTVDLRLIFKFLYSLVSFYLFFKSYGGMLLISFYLWLLRTEKKFFSPPNTVDASLHVTGYLSSYNLFIFYFLLLLLSQSKCFKHRKVAFFTQHITQCWTLTRHSILAWWIEHNRKASLSVWDIPSTSTMSTVTHFSQLYNHSIALDCVNSWVCAPENPHSDPAEIL